jgi:hypothetical protein
MQTAIQVMQKLVYAWGVRCFGKPHMMNASIRSLRLAEEVVELAQSLHVSRDRMHRLVDIVYDRPIGQPVMEMGGLMLGVVALCEAAGWDPEECLQVELGRVLAKPVEHFTARNNEKLGLGLD